MCMQSCLVKLMTMSCRETAALCSKLLALVSAHKTSSGSLLEGWAGPCQADNAALAAAALCGPNRGCCAAHSWGAADIA